MGMENLCWALADAVQRYLCPLDQGKKQRLHAETDVKITAIQVAK